MGVVIGEEKLLSEKVESRRLAVSLSLAARRSVLVQASLGETRPRGAIGVVIREETPVFVDHEMLETRTDLEQESYSKGGI